MVATNPAITGMIRTSHPERPGPGSRKRRASVRQRTERQAATGHNPCDDQRGRPAGCRTATSGMRGSPPPPRISTHHLLEQVAPMVHRILILPRVAVDAKILQDMLGRRWNAPFELEWLTSLQAGMARPACGAIGSVPVEPCLDDRDGMQTFGRLCALVRRIPNSKRGRATASAHRWRRDSSPGCSKRGWPKRCRPEPAGPAPVRAGAAGMPCMLPRSAHR